MAADHLQYCVELVREGDRDRYLTLLFAPEAARGHLAALAAFNLELARTRDQVSESLLGLIRLQWWREAVEEIRGGGRVREHQVAQALAAATRAHGLDTARMLAMVEARESELESTEPPSAAVFLDRADATAGNLLHLSLQVLGLDAGSADLSAAATRIGRAYAASGLARSVLPDARRRQVRLPREALERAGVALDPLFELKPQPQLAAALRQVSADAERNLAEARRIRLPKAARPLILTGRIAALHLERLRLAAYDPFDPAALAGHPMDAWRLLWSNLASRF